MSNVNRIDPAQSPTTEVIRWLRFPMIVLVTYAHSYSNIAADYSLSSSDWNTYEFLKLLISQTLVKVAVPVFFIISGYLFFANVETWNMQVYKAKILRRLKTLLIPYFVWNLLMAVKLKAFSWSMFWVYWKPAGTQIDWFGVEQFMTAPANMPLWFLRDLMAVSLLTPIIYIAVRRLGFWLMGVLTVLYLSGVCAFIPGLSAYAVYFFTFGAFLSIRRQDLVLSLRRVELPACVLSVVFALAMMFFYRAEAFSSFMLAFRLVGAVAVFCIGSRLSRYGHSLGSQLSRSSFFIYLAHYVFFMSFIDTAFFSFFGTSSVSLSIHYLLCPLVKAAIFVFFYFIFVKIMKNIAARALL